MATFLIVKELSLNVEGKQRLKTTLQSIRLYSTIKHPDILDFPVIIEDKKVKKSPVVSKEKSYLNIPKKTILLLYKYQ
jgi:hypothetical protein